MDNLDFSFAVVVVLVLILFALFGVIDAISENQVIIIPDNVNKKENLNIND